MGYSIFDLEPSPVYQLPIHSPSIPVALGNCPKQICDEFIRSLHLSYAYFKPSHDACYCSKDYLDTRPKIEKAGGYRYTVPCGWVRFSLKIYFALCRGKSIFQSWATSYYGTSVNQIEKILRNRFVPFPGDQLSDGQRFLACIPDDRNDCCTSPSIHYISTWYSRSTSRFNSSDGNTYEIQRILQCQQKPGTFEMKKGEPNWCSILPRDQMVWKSNRRSTIVPCAIMVRARMFRH